MQNEPQDAYMPDSHQERLEPFDAREIDTRRGKFMLAGLLLLLFLIVLVGFKLYAAGTRDRDQAPRVLADNRPYKVKPADPGGVQMPNQDKEVYNNLGSETPTETVTLTEPAENPIAKPQNSKPAANIIIKSPEPSQPIIKPIATPITKPVVKPQRAPKPAPRPVTTDGNYVVQIASLRSEPEAEAMWNRLKAKMGSTIKSGYYADIKRVNLETKGIYYRLRIAGVGDQAAAKRLCDQLKAQNQECFVTKR